MWKANWKADHLDVQLAVPMVLMKDASTAVNLAVRKALTMVNSKAASMVALLAEHWAVKLVSLPVVLKVV